MTEGIILKGIGGFYYVDTPEGLIECKARGRFRRTVGKPIVGDRVTLEIQPEDGTGYLLDIAPRKNSLVRPAVANLDLLVAVASAAPPVTDPFLIDRVTAIAVHKDMDVLVVINKTDEDPGDELYETYRKSGIQTLRVSALTGDGIDALKAYIRGKVSAFAGTSGVGKSTLLALAAGECVPCSMVFQDMRLVEDASALDNVLVCADARVDASSAAALLRLLVPGINVHARVAELSGGQRRRVEIARALLCPGDAVILDEPFTGLDAAARDATAVAVLDLLDGRMLLLATHDVVDARALNISDIITL